MRAGLLVGLILLGAAAPAEAAIRLEWRGVAAEGKAPAHLDAAIRAHLAVALRPLEMLLVGAPPADGAGDARCQFLPGPPRVGRCVVEVVHSQGGERAERRVDIPYRDADDLAESIALLVADMLGSDLHDILIPSPGSIEPEEPPPAPPSPPAPRVQSAPLVLPPEPAIAPPTASEPPAPGASSSPSAFAQRARPRSSSPPDAPGTATRRRLEPRPPGRLELEAGPTLAFGFAGDPLLGGLRLCALYAGPVAFRLGGALSLAGGAAAASRYQLSFVRLQTGPRAGAGFTRGRWDGELTLGPALYLLATSASPGGDHTMVSFAVVLGARLAVALTPSLGLGLGADLTTAVTDERVVAGAQELAHFGRLSLETFVLLAYRR